MRMRRVDNHLNLCLLLLKRILPWQGQERQRLLWRQLLCRRLLI
jgi:hypothetical protein